ncbi:hypothetical protein Mapa_014000 [Marchantia paleacea]|nr:hypothetical protein Mapa_014000 [Marchantia paleacea]
MGASVRNENSLTGMKKWLADYRAKRPGLDVLQKEVDDFMADFDAKEEKARLEKMAAAEEEGWTLVVGNKGRKKTTDTESGVRVGAISSLAAEEKSKKQSKKETTDDFYRFQRRDARRNEVLELQKKFEEDKKRIAKMREARKFRPY